VIGKVVASDNRGATVPGQFVIRNRAEQLAIDLNLLASSRATSAASGR
jgi:hypothetical protein